MDALLHCRACEAPLRVPRNSAGHRARCPQCGHQFMIPAERELMEETISFWIEQDVDEIFEGSNDAIQEDGARSGAAAGANQSTARQQAGETSRAPQSGASPSASSSERAPAARSRDDRAPSDRAPSDRAPADEAGASAGHAETQRAAPGGRMRGAVSTSGLDAASPPRTGASRHAVAHPAPPLPHEEAGDELPEQYPQDLFVRDTVPHLVVRRCDSVGVCFAFDSRWLRHEGFRASMPVKCVFSGATDRSKLIARPLVFHDRCELRRPPTVDQMSREHEDHVIGDRSTRERMRLMGELESMPEPFHLVMPYYVSTQYAHLYLHCEAHDRGDDGVTCEVLIPDALCGLDWLARVNGVCGIDYRMLEHETSLLHGEQWRRLPAQVRQHVAAWCKLRPREVLRLYLNDADFGRRDAGLAGVVVTDQRVVFNKYHHRGEIALNSPDAAILARCDDQFAHLTLAVGSSRNRMVKLHRHDLETLIDALQNSDGVRVVMCQ